MFKKTIFICALAAIIISSCNSLYWRKIPKDINPSDLSKETRAEYDSLMTKLTNQNRWHIPPHKNPEIINIKVDSIPQRFWNIISYDEMLYTNNAKTYYGAAINALSKQKDTVLVKTVQDMYYHNKNIAWEILPEDIAGQYNQFEKVVKIDTLKNKDLNLVKKHEGDHQYDYGTQIKKPIRVKGISSFIAFSELMAHTSDYVLKKSGYGFEKKDLESFLYTTFEHKTYNYIYKKDVKNFLQNPSVQRLLEKAKSKRQEVSDSLENLGKQINLIVNERDSLSQVYEKQKHFDPIKKKKQFDNNQMKFKAMEAKQKAMEQKLKLVNTRFLHQK